MKMKQRRGGRTWFEGRLHWLYYWLDLYGPDGRPSHTKVLSAWGFYFALTFEAVMGIRMVFADIIVQPDMAFTTLVLGTLAVPMGKGAFSRVAGSTSEQTYTETDEEVKIETRETKGAASPIPDTDKPEPS